MGYFLSIALASSISVTRLTILTICQDKIRGWKVHNNELYNIGFLSEENKTACPVRKRELGIC